MLRILLKQVQNRGIILALLQAPDVPLVFLETFAGVSAEQLQLRHSAEQLLQLPDFLRHAFL